MFHHFKRILCLVILFSLVSAFAEDKPEQIVVGVIPGGSPIEMKKQGVLFAQELQDQLGIKVNIYISKDYNTLIEAMKEKKVDFAFFTALSFVYAEKTAAAKVLLKKVYQDPFYFSAIVTLKKNKINRIIDLKNRKMAFVDSKSTSGYLYPKVQLKKMNFQDSDFKEILFSGNHSQSISWLLDGKVDAAAVFSDDQEGKSGAWSKYSEKDKNLFKILWVSEPIPTDPFTVRQDFYDKFPNITHQVMVSIVDIFENPKNQGKFRDILGIKSLLPATSKQYEPVRDVIKNLNLQIN